MPQASKYDQNPFSKAHHFEPGRNNYFDKRSIIPFSYKLLIFLALVYLVNIFTRDYLSNLLYLKTNLVLENGEYWRLFSFPFAMSTLEGNILFFVTFLFFAPKLEKLFHRLVFPVLLILLCCLQGTIVTIAFWKSPIIFKGMEGISFFILTMFLLSNIKKKYKFIFSKKVKTITVITLVFCLWFISVFLHSVISGSHIFFLQGMTSMVFGITSGSLSYLQIRFTRNYISNRLKHSDYSIPKPSDLFPAPITFKQANKINSNLKNKSSFGNKKEILSETRLNEILEKLHEFGKESLTQHEINYLIDYSKSL